MIKVGTKVRFDPYHEMHSYGVSAVKGEVIGTVIAVYPKHNYFTAEYKAAGSNFKISFKFDDLNGSNKTVYIVKE